MSHTDNRSHQPIIYVPHGGGPLPLLGDPGHEDMVRFLRSFGAAQPRPSAILVVSAHWEAERPTLTSSARPDLLFDYGGFPEEAYQFRYPVPGAPDLAAEAADLLRTAGIEPALDERRGLDHGVFVPLMLMFPDADIPVVELSLVRGLDPQLHVDVGKALATLGDGHLLVIGSGMSFHNPRGFMQGGTGAQANALAFDAWMCATCTDPSLDHAEREAQLVAWESAPEARFCHPREEHLVPLHVCYGMASERSKPAEVAYSGEFSSLRISSLLWR